MILSTRSLRALLALSVSLFAFTSLHAQVQASAPVTVLPGYDQQWDLYGAYAASHFNPGTGRGVPAIWLHGWRGDATAWFRQLFGLEFSARGYYGTITVPANAFNVTSSNMSQHIFLVGPNFRVIRRQNYTVGGHVLLGAADGSFDQGFKNSGVQPSQVGIYNNKVAFGMAVGAWYDYNLTPRWSVRATTEWQPTHYGFTTQNEFAGSVGIVYKAGRMK